MRKLFPLFVTVCFLSVTGHAQVMLAPSVIVSAGGFAESESINITWSLGELATSTLLGENMILTC